MSPINVPLGSRKGSAIHFLIVGGRFFRLFGGQTGGTLGKWRFWKCRGHVKNFFFIFWNCGGIDISWFYVENRFVRNFLPDTSFHRNVPLRTFTQNLHQMVSLTTNFHKKIHQTVYFFKNTPNRVLDKDVRTKNTPNGVPDNDIWQKLHQTVYLFVIFWFWG